MSTCQSNNICSLYIDNELSQSQLHTFEEHLTTCTECTKKIEKLRNISNKLHSINDSPDIEDGYKRLKARLSYKMHLAPYGSSRDPYFIFKLTPVLAAAAIIAVFLPLLHIHTTNTENTQNNLPAISNTLLLSSTNTMRIAPIQEKGIIVDEAITATHINSNSEFLRSIVIDPTKFTEFDVFKPEILKETDSIDIIIFDTPALVFHEVDSFGFSHPVFLLQE